jgi:heme/copper-type cytochrome/quinol oxidase subunit 1
MDWFSKSFLKASVTWLVLGGLGGIGMGVYPEWTVYRATHTHMMLVGFVTMMIFGVGYHVIPRFAGAPIRNLTAPIVHWWLANLGLLLMIVGFILRPNGAAVSSAASWFIGVGGALSGLGTLVFVWVVWDSMTRSPIGRRARPVSEAAPLKERRLPTTGQE